MKPAWGHPRVGTARFFLLRFAPPRARRSAAVLVFVAVLLGAGCGGHSGPTAPAPPATGTPPPPSGSYVTTFKVTAVCNNVKTPVDCALGATVHPGTTLEVTVDILYPTSSVVIVSLHPLEAEDSSSANSTLMPAGQVGRVIYKIKGRPGATADGFTVELRDPADVYGAPITAPVAESCRLVFAEG